MLTSQQIADKYFEKYTQLIISTNKIAAIVFLLLIFNWLFVIESSYSGYLNSKKDHQKFVQKSIDTIQKINNNLKSFQLDTLRELRPLNSQLVSATDKLNFLLGKTRTSKDSLDKYRDSIDKYEELREIFQDSINTVRNAFILKNKDSIERINDRLTSEKIKLQSASKFTIDSTYKNLVDDIPFPFKAVVFISVGTNGPLIISFLFCLLVIYLLIMRTSALSYVSKAIRLYKITPELRINRYQDFSLPAPFWLAPLPTNKDIQNNTKIKSEDLCNILNWKSATKYNHFLVFILLASILLIELRLNYISSQINTQPERIVQSFFFNLLFLICTLISVMLWLISRKIPDNFNYEGSPNILGRKDFIILTATLLFYLSVAKYAWGNSSRVSKIYFKNNYKRKRKNKFISTEKKNAFFINKKSKKIHFIDEHGFSPDFKTISSKGKFDRFINNMKEFFETNNTSMQNLNIATRNVSWNIEGYAINLIKENKKEQAIELLNYAIERNTKSIRIFDLLMILCVRNAGTVTDSKLILKNLKHFALRSSNTLLNQRAEKWENKLWVDKIKSKSIYLWNNTQI